MRLLMTRTIYLKDQLKTRLIFFNPQETDY